MVILLARRRRVEVGVIVMLRAREEAWSGKVVLIMMLRGWMRGGLMVVSPNRIDELTVFKSYET